MNLISYAISVDLRKGLSTQVLRAAKGDTGRTLQISLSQEGEPYSPEAGAYAVIMGKKPDGTAIYNPCTISGTDILYSFTDQTTSCVGSFPLQVRIYGADQKILTSVPIQLEVYPTAYDADSAKASADEQKVLDDLVNRTRSLQLDLQHQKEAGELRGESAYEIAVRRGYQGTEEEWLQSLQYAYSEDFHGLADQVRRDQISVSMDLNAAKKCVTQAQEQQAAAAGSAEEAGKQVQRARELADAMKIEQIPMTASAARLIPGNFYVWGEISSLTVTLEPEKPGVRNEYMFAFSSPAAEPTNLNVPGEIKWVHPLVIEGGKKYQVSIVNGMGVYAGV